MSGVSAVVPPGHGDAGVSDSRSSNSTTSGGGRNNSGRGSSGTMQLLDRLGYGLVSLSPPLDTDGPESARANSKGTGHAQGAFPPDHLPRPKQRHVQEERCPPQAGNETPSTRAGLTLTTAESRSSFSSLRPQQQPQQRQRTLPPAAMANLISLSRIRKLVAPADDGEAARTQHEEVGGQDEVGGGDVRAAEQRGGGAGESPGAMSALPIPGGVSCGKIRGSHVSPDATAVFRGVRVLLEQQNAGDQPGSEQVALECLSVLRESVSWLSRTLSRKEASASSAGPVAQLLSAGRRGKGSGIAQGRDQCSSVVSPAATATIAERSCSNSNSNTSSLPAAATSAKMTTAMIQRAGAAAPPVPQLHGPGHDFHAARACIASILPAVIDCCSTESLRGSAEDVLVECAAARELPDVPSILVDQLVYHGMEHDDESIRMWSTRTPVRLLTRGLVLEDREYGSLLKGLVGRVRDVNDGVVDAAVNELGRMYRAGPDTFRAAEACLDSVHRQLIQHYSARIHSQRGSSDANDGKRDRGVASRERGAVPAIPGTSITRDDAGKGGALTAAATVLAGGSVADGCEETGALAAAPQGKSDFTSSFFSPPESGAEDGDEENDEDDDEGEDDEEEATASSESSEETDSSDSSSGSSSSSSSGGGSRGGGNSSSVSGEGKERREGDREKGGGEEEDEGEDSDAGEDERPSFEPILDGVSVTARLIGFDTKEPEEGGGTVGSRKPSRKTTTHLQHHQQQQERHHDHQPALQNDDKHSSPPRPVLAGPTATEVPATVGGQGGIGACALTTQVAINTRKKLTGVGEVEVTLKGEGERRRIGASDHGSGPQEGTYERRSGGALAGERKGAAAAAEPPSPLSSRDTRIKPSAVVTTAERLLDDSTTLSLLASPKKRGQPSTAAAEKIHAKANEAMAAADAKSASTRARQGKPTACEGPTIAAPSAATSAVMPHPSISGAPITAGSTRGIGADGESTPSPFLLGELLHVLVQVEATAPEGVCAGNGGGVGGGGSSSSNNSNITTSRKTPILHSPTAAGVERERGRGAAVVGRPWASETHGGPRQERVRAMETAKRLVSDLETREGEVRGAAPGVSSASASTGIMTEQMGELLVVALRLTDDSDFKIALLALQVVHALVVVAGERIRPPHLALVFEALACRLGDNKVAARHHAMVALSALVRSAGLPLTAPYLAWHGLRSATWRKREGALKLMVVGLLSPCRWGQRCPPTVPSSEQSSSAEREDRDGGSEEFGERFSSGRGRRDGIPSAIEEDQLMREVGSLLTDDRPEVRHASLEVLALAASVWGMKESDVFQVLDPAERLSSTEERRRLAARLRDPPLSLSRMGPDDTVVLGNCLVPRSLSTEHGAGAQRPAGTGSVGSDGEADAAENRGKDDGHDDGDGKSSGGGSGSAPRAGTSTLRCWRSTECGGREEITPWERHHGSGGMEGRREGHEITGGQGCKYESRVAIGSHRAAVRSRADDVEQGCKAGSGPCTERIHPTRTTGQGAKDRGAEKIAALASSPYNTGGSGGGGARIGASIPRRRVSPPDLGSGKVGGGDEGDGKEQARGREGIREGRRGTMGNEEARAEEGRSYIPSWAAAGGDNKHRTIAAEKTGHYESRVHQQNKPKGHGSQRSNTFSTSAVDNENDRGSNTGGVGTVNSSGGSVGHSSERGTFEGVQQRQRELGGRGDAQEERRRIPSMGQENKCYHSPRETAGMWEARHDGEGEKQSEYRGGCSRWEHSQRGGNMEGGGVEGESSGDDEEGYGGGAWGGGAGRCDGMKMAPKGGGLGPRCSAIPDPDLLSTLKRGGSRNAKASRRAASAAAGGGGGGGGDSARSGRTAGRQGSRCDPAYPACDRDDDGGGGGSGGRMRPRPRGGAPAEPTTPVPIGRYDHLGRRSQMETTVQQPLPLSLIKDKRAGCSTENQNSAAMERAAETFVTGISVDSRDDKSDSASGDVRQRSSGVSSATKRRMERRQAMERETQESMRWARASEDDDNDHDSPNHGGSSGSELWPHRHRRPGGRGISPPLAAATRVMSVTNDEADESTGRAGRLIDATGGGGVGREKREKRSAAQASRPGGDVAVNASPSPSTTALAKPDSFDYLAAEDIRPSPNPNQELQRAMASLPRDDWPEIFHTLNSVRRLATHHGPLLGSQAHLHALVRDVVGQAENLRSQVAKNALLTLADLWRGLGDNLDPELPMVCPVLVKKLADKVEFLAEAARECVEEVVETATESRSLSAFLACGTHRSPAIRAKSALATLLCVRRRCYSANGSAPRPYPTGRATKAASALLSSRGKTGGGERRSDDGSDRGGGGPGIGGRLGAREMDRLLAAVPRFLQDGNQETRHHAKAMVAILLDAGEVDDPRLRREIPPPIFERLQRDLLNPSFLSGPDFTAPPNTATTGSRSSSSSSYYGSRNGRKSVGSSGTINRRLGATGPAASNGLVTSPGLGRTSSTASGGGGAGFDGDATASIGGVGGLRRRGAEGSGGGSNRWMLGDGERWRWRGDSGEIRARDSDGCADDDGMGESGSGSATSPPRRHFSPPPSVPRSRNRFEGEKGSGSGARSALACSPPPTKGSSNSGGSSSIAKRRPNKGLRCREAELLLPALYARLDSGDWRERLKGLDEATSLLEGYGSDLHAAGKSARLVDRMAELLSDGNLKVNLLALEEVVRLGCSMGDRLEPCVNTLVPAVCKNLASSNQQRASLAEEALDALCEAIDPCLLVQPVASLAQYGNARLKVPMLALLRDLTPDVGDMKPILLTKYVRPAALSLVRENRPNVRDAGLSLLRAVEMALVPTSSAVSSSFKGHKRGGSSGIIGGRAGRGGRGSVTEYHGKAEKESGDLGDGGKSGGVGGVGGGGRVGGWDGSGGGRGGGSGRRRRAVEVESSSGHDPEEGDFGEVRGQNQRHHRHHDGYAESASSASVMTGSGSSHDRYYSYSSGERRAGGASRRR